MRRAASSFLALVLTAAGVNAQDVCAGAPLPQRAVSRRAPALGGAGMAAAAAGGVVAARGVNMYPGSGAGPAPDVTDWQPKARIPIGKELIIQGRGLVPGQLVALLGGNELTPTSQTAFEIHFAVPEPIAAGPLVVYNKNGQPRTLEASYIAYDPTPYITRVVPTVIGVGDPVTVCGVNLFDVVTRLVYSSAPVPFSTLMSQVRQEPGDFFQLGKAWIKIDNPVMSPSGDRITFRVGQAFTEVPTCWSMPCNTPTTVASIIAPFTSTPPTLSGVMGMVIKNLKNQLIGPSLTWNGAAQAPPRITAVYGQYFSSRDPFVIQPTPSMQGALSQAYVEGQNLKGTTWKIGAMTVSGSAEGGSLPPDGSKAILTVPLNASTGLVCASSTIATACSPAPLTLFGGPVISRMPSPPFSLRTNYTIEGLNLLPPATVTGVKYRWHAGQQMLDSTATNVACNMVLQVLEHTANRITFRIGDPAKTAPVPASCATSPLFQPSPSFTMNIEATLAGAPGVQLLLKQVPFYLKP